MTARRVTLGDVARAADVSAATVSRSLRDDPQISVSTRARVRQIADELGYVPNVAAQSLVLQQSTTFGLLIPDVADPIHGQVVSAFQQRANELGYSVILACGLRNAEVERRSLRSFASHRVAGVATMGSVLRQDETLDLLAPSRVVMMMSENLRLSDFALELPVGCLRCDERDGMRQVVDLLDRLRVERVCFVGVSPRASMLIRRDGLVTEMAARGFGEPIVHTISVDDHLAYRGLAKRITEEGQQAVVCYDDQTALHVMDALRAMGRRIPDDVTVIGFDDIPFAALANPRLTTVAQSSAEMAALAATMLADAANGAPLAASQLLPVTLIERESTTKGRGPRRRRTVNSATSA